MTVLRFSVRALDAANATEFKRALHEHLAAGKYVLDLAEVGFVDSSGVGALLSGLRHATAQSGSVKLCGLQPNVAELFRMVRMDRIFDLYPNAAAAIADFRA